MLHRPPVTVGYEPRARRKQAAGDDGRYSPLNIARANNQRVDLSRVCPVWLYFWRYLAPIMPGHRRALCPVRRGVITGIRPYARYQEPSTRSARAWRAYIGSRGTATTWAQDSTRFQIYCLPVARGVVRELTEVTERTSMWSDFDSHKIPVFCSME